MHVCVYGGMSISQMNMSESAADSVDIKAVKSDIADAIDAEFERRGDGSSMAGTRIV